MKNPIIYLGITLVSLTNISSASNLNLQDSKQNYQPHVLLYTTESLNNTNSHSIKDELIFNPDTVLKESYDFTIEVTIAEDNKIIESNISNENELLFIEKPIEEVINADNQIIESKIDNEVRPIYLEKTIEDYIAEDNKIIDSNFNNECQPLDFEKINNSSNSIQQITIEKFIGM